MIVLLYRLPGGRLSLENEPHAMEIAATVGVGLGIRRKSKGQARIISGNCDMSLEAAIEAGLLTLHWDAVIPAPEHGYASAHLRAADAAAHGSISVGCARCRALANVTDEPKVGWCPRCERFQFLHEAMHAALPDASHFFCIACGEGTWCEHFIVCDAVGCAQRRHVHSIGDCPGEATSEAHEVRSATK
jgi:hypothetical protein